MKNQVIKVLTKEHGEKVIQYWKDRGVNTEGYKGTMNEEAGNMCVYYGVINSSFENYYLEQVQRANAEIIELPSKEEEEPIFKVGDKIYCINYGWGIIQALGNVITINFDGEIIHFNKDARLLSFTEYTLQGFSQERPIELPEVGELCLFYDDEDALEEGDTWCGKFQSYKQNERRPYMTSDNSSWVFCKRIKILD